jgi:hypothetical protein
LNLSDSQKAHGALFLLGRVSALQRARKVSAGAADFHLRPFRDPRPQALMNSLSGSFAGPGEEATSRVTEADVNDA